MDGCIDCAKRDVTNSRIMLVVFHLALIHFLVRGTLHIKNYSQSWWDIAWVPFYMWAIGICIVAIWKEFDKVSNRKARLNRLKGN